MAGGEKPAERAPRERTDKRGWLTMHAIRAVHAAIQPLSVGKLLETPHNYPSLHKKEEIDASVRSYNRAYANETGTGNTRTFL